jgi:riboflavin kinase/FMN adenylyltransferase
MRVVRSLSEAPSDVSSVVTIGNFDGFHRGHASIFGRVRERAGELGSQAVAITFDPHPLKHLQPDRAPRLITTLEQRIRLIAESGIDLLLIQSFNEDFSQLSPEQFIDSYLVGHFRAKALCVGHNFRFGHRHRGNLETLGRWADRFELIDIGPVATGNQVVSSSRIRGLLVEGRVSLARRMLGRCHEIEGDVVTGAGRGRNVTVPTINLKPPNELIPCDGVYLTRITLDDNSYQDAVTNIGVRPTFGETEKTVETHILDSTAPRVGGQARLRFIRRLRDERKFRGLDELRNQIQHDIATAHKFFRRLDRARCQTVREESVAGAS